MDEGDFDEELNKTDPKLQSDDYGTYDNYDIIPDEPEEDSSSEQNEEQPSEEEQAEEIENQVKSATENKAKEVAKETAKNTVKASGKAIKKGFITAVKFLFTPPVLYITLAVLLVLILIVGIMMVVAMVGAAEEAPYGNVNPSEGSFATSFGITGDKFYGARAIYYNPTQAKLDLKDYYNAFSEDFLERVNNLEQIDLNVNVDLENITPEFCKMIAKAVSNSTIDLTFDEYLNNINHFGYTNIQLDNIQVSFVNYLLNNQSTLLSIDQEYTGNLENELSSLFDDNYSNYNVTAPLYYVKDIVLEDEESMLPTLEQENYVALILMPKTEVNLNSTSFMFYFPDTETANYASTIDIEFISVKNGTKNTIYTATANSSWWESNYAKEIAEIEGINTTLPTFSSFNVNNALNNVNLYSLLLNEEKTLILNQENKVNFNEFNDYFNSNLIVDDENDLCYYTVNYLPSKENDYAYLKLNGNGVFQFCEYITEFE